MLLIVFHATYWYIFMQSTTAYDCLEDYSDWLEGAAVGCESAYGSGDDASCMVSASSYNNAAALLHMRQSVWWWCCCCCWYLLLAALLL